MANSMNIVTAIVLTIGAVAVLVWGLMRVLHDLLERGPYDAPLIEESPHRREDPVGWHPEKEAGRSDCQR
jgi:hypothetical protein